MTGCLGLHKQCFNPLDSFRLNSWKASLSATLRALRKTQATVKLSSFLKGAHVDQLVFFFQNALANGHSWLINGGY